MARRITEIKVSPSCSVITGYGARELITELRGRPPMWSSNPRGWVVQPSTAADVLALAEERGYQVVVQQEADLAG